MSASRLALYAAIGAAVAWTAKAVVIGLAGGLGRSALEGPLFLLGLVAALVGAGALGAAVAAGRPTRHRVAVGVLGIVGIALLAGVLSPTITALAPSDAGWVWSEVNLWIQAAVLLGAAVGVQRRRPVAT